MGVERFPVEEGMVLMFARAIGDPNPIYSDPRYAAQSPLGRMIAPPTFVQASAQFDPDYPLRPKPGERWFGSGRNPTGLVAGGGGSDGGDGGGGDGGGGDGGMGSGRGLHAEQEYVYHRSLLVGDVLSATSRPGERWEKQGRSGTLVFSEHVTEYRDQKGELVVTARTVGVVTERPPAASEGS